MVTRKEQVMMMGGGLMVAIGFMFMGAANLSGLTTNEGAQQGQPQEIDVELPEENYVEGGFDLGVNEQVFLSQNNQVVFVNALYADEGDPDVFEGLRGIEDEFEGRVYFTEAEAAESDLSTQLQIEEYPEIVVIGDQPSEGAGYTLDTVQNDREEVNNAICSSMASTGDLAATCF